MSGLRSQFIFWYYNEFHADPLFQAMTKVKENSPWHREENVGIHTDMVVSQCISRTGSCEWVHEDLICALACAFHDVGKPAALVRKWKESRGDYNSFNGHELISARLWEDWAVRNWERLQKMWIFPLSPAVIYDVGWLIEHHKPWDLKRPEKLDMIAQTANLAPGGQLYGRVLAADTWGRMSDDEPEKREKVEDWIETMTERMIEVRRLDEPDPNKPFLILPIGASGTGKSSTYQKIVQGREYTHYYSWDALRLDWYASGSDCRNDPPVDRYSVAYQRSTKDKEFGRKTQAEFIKLVKTGHNVYVDNTNLSRKRRRFFVDQARSHGYFVMAVLYPIALDELLRRQKTRYDKVVPDGAVKGHYMHLQLPLYGEVDEIMVMGNNIPGWTEPTT